MVSVDFHESKGLEFIGDVAFQFTTVNPEYTEFTIVVKWLYILLALEVWFLFRRSLRKVSEGTVRYLTSGVEYMLSFRSF